MGKTKIEWVKNPDGTQGYSWNPITGCLNGCEYCYARKLANGRLKSRYLANHEITTGSFQAPKGRPVFNRGLEERPPFITLGEIKNYGVRFSTLTEMLGEV